MCRKFSKQRRQFWLGFGRSPSGLPRTKGYSILLNVRCWAGTIDHFLIRDSDAFPDLLTLHQVRTLEFLPPTESWLVNSNFPRASRIQGIVWSSGCGQFMWFIKAPSISSPRFCLCCSRSFSSMIFKMAVRGEKTLQRLLLQNLQKSWRFLSRDLMRSSKQNGGKRFARIFLKPLKHYAGMAS